MKWDFRNRYRRDKSRPPADNLESAREARIAGLVRRAIEDDVEAFGELYLAYVQNIYRYIFSHVNSKTLSEDITEDVFLKAWRSIKTCRGRENTFASWLYRIAHNQLIDELRKVQRHPLIDIEEVGTLRDTKGKTEGYSEQQELISLINRLPENQRQVIILKFIEERDNSEIARIMRKSEGAIRVLQMRALRALKNELNKE